MLSGTEENYMKALFHLTCDSTGKKETGTNDVAARLNVKPASVNGMLKKLKEKDFIVYQKYGKISLTKTGKKIALEIIRKHRLWETFLYEKLEFSWDEVHEVAEQLEHIKSQKLIDQLDKLLGYPQIDPHGDPIPNHKGEIKIEIRKTLNEIEKGKTCKLVAVKDNSAEFLKYVVKLGLGISSKIKINHRHEFDGSIEIEINGQCSTVSQKFAENIYVI